MLAVGVRRIHWPILSDPAGSVGRMTTMTTDTVHHLYVRPGDLMPYCGVTPGRNERTGDWHTGHDKDTLLMCLSFGLPCCITCLSTDALGGDAARQPCRSSVQG